MFNGAMAPTSLIHNPSLDEWVYPIGGGCGHAKASVRVQSHVCPVQTVS